jgi:hypothetical protein
MTFRLWAAKELDAIPIRAASINALGLSQNLLRMKHMALHYMRSINTFFNLLLVVLICEKFISKNFAFNN